MFAAGGGGGGGGGIDSARQTRKTGTSDAARRGQVLFGIFMNFCDYATSRKTHPISRKLR